jgi:hypothetical protein
MNKFTVIFAAAAIASSVGVAEAGSSGWGGNSSSSLINISPTIDLGKIGLLNNVLSGNNILSGNLVSGILNGNKTSLVGGVLSGLGINLLGGNSYKLGSRH